MTHDNDNNATIIPFPSTGFEPGTFGCHEAFTLVLFFAEAIEQQLLDHPSIAHTKQWRVQTSHICDLLHELYQSIGEAHLKDYPEGKGSFELCVHEWDSDHEDAACIHCGVDRCNYE
jgi:hypothetical protein